MRSFFIMVCAAAALLLCGCAADPVVFSEVFQLKEGERLYTKYNIWYEDPANISSLNIQRGTFIPLGTEITPVKTTSFGDKIIFKDKKGKQYTIRFSAGYRLCTMADYIGYTFTTQDRETLLRGIPDNVRRRILRGEVVPGMTPDQVILAYGPAPAIRTPDKRSDCWIYFLTKSQVIRVLFRGGIVRKVLNIDNVQ